MQPKTFPESQNHGDWRESKLRRPFFRSLLAGPIACRINAIPSRHRIRVRTNDVNDVIEPINTHHFNVIINHLQEVDAAASEALHAAQQAVPFPATQNSAYPLATEYADEDYQFAAEVLDEQENNTQQQGITAEDMPF